MLMAASAAIRRIATYAKSEAFGTADLTALQVRVGRLDTSWQQFNQTYMEVVVAVVGNDIAVPEKRMVATE